MRRRKSTVFFLISGICLIALAIALNVGWILLNLQEIALLVFGIVFFALIITGLVLNTTFLLREIRRNEQHDAFLNAVTHELKTPIASIRLYLETLKTREVTPEKREEFYDVMLSDSDRLLTTVEQVLHASRSRVQKKIDKAEPVIITDIIRESAARVLSRYNLPKELIEFKDFDKNIIMKGETGDLGVIFTNLLDNAVKYSGEDKIVYVSIKILENKLFEIRIKDSGVGIPANELNRVFKRFYRIPGVSMQNVKGTGLGLFIVKTLVKKHRGKIRVESKGSEKGSEFIVQFPQVKAKSKKVKK
jgi:two-component system, OmpR family, sensor histidine kinase SenX3